MKRILRRVRERIEAASSADLRAARESQAIRLLLDAELNRLEVEALRLEEATFGLSARCSWDEDLLNNAAEVLLMKRPNKWTTAEHAFMRAHATREKLTEYAYEDPARCGLPCGHAPGTCSLHMGHSGDHAATDTRGNIFCQWAK